jgi:hypothetical protein
MSSAHLHLVEVLILSGPDFCPFGVKVGADLDLGFLRDLGLPLLHGEGLLPLCQLLLPRKDVLL